MYLICANNMNAHILIKGDDRQWTNDDTYNVLFIETSFNIVFKPRLILLSPSAQNTPMTSLIGLWICLKVHFFR